MLSHLFAPLARMAGAPVPQLGGLPDSAQLACLILSRGQASNWVAQEVNMQAKCITNPLRCAQRIPTHRTPKSVVLLAHSPKQVLRMQPACEQHGDNAMRWPKQCEFGFLCTWKWEVHGKACDRSERSSTDLLIRWENKMIAFLLGLSWKNPVG